MCLAIALFALWGCSESGPDTTTSTTIPSATSAPTSVPPPSPTVVPPTVLPAATSQPVSTPSPSLIPQTSPDPTSVPAPSPTTVPASTLTPISTPTQVSTATTAPSDPPTPSPTPTPVPTTIPVASVAAGWYNDVNVFDSPLFGGLSDYATAIDIGLFAETPIEAWLLGTSVSQLHAKGIAYVGSVSIYNIESPLTFALNPDLADGFVRNIDGDFVDVWWQRYPGVEPYWGSTLHPQWQDFLRAQVKRLIDTGVDGIWFDELLGSVGVMLDDVHNGDFNQVVIDGFRDYLAQEYSASQLVELGVDDIDSFGYRQFIIDEGFAPQISGEPDGRWQVSLFEDFHAYIDSENEKFVIELMMYAKEYGNEQGRDIAVTANIYNLEPASMRFLPYVDYPYIEFPYFEDYPAITRPAPVLRLANALEKRSLLIPSFTSSVPRLLELENTTMLLQSWIAEAYANGGAFSVPNGFTGTAESDGEFSVEMFVGEMGLIEPYYAFVLENRYCCRVFRTQADVALVYHAPSEREELDDYRSLFIAASQALLENNIQYNVLYLDGDNSDELDVQVVVMVTPAVALTEAEQGVMAGATIVGFDTGTTANDLQAAVLAETTQIIEVGADNIEAYVSASDAGLVVNLLNRAYDLSSDTVTDASDFSIMLRLPDDRAVSAVELSSPDGGLEMTLAFQQNGRDLSFIVPTLHVWDLILVK